MRITTNGQATDGTLSNIINGVPVFSVGGGTVSMFQNITAEPPDVTPVDPDNLRDTSWTTSLPDGLGDDFFDDSPARDVDSLTVNIPVPSGDYFFTGPPSADVDSLTVTIPVPSGDYFLDDSPARDVDSLTVTIPTPLT